MSHKRVDFMGREQKITDLILTMALARPGMPGPLSSQFHSGYTNLRGDQKRMVFTYNPSGVDGSAEVFIVVKLFLDRAHPGIVRFSSFKVWSGIPLIDVVGRWSMAITYPSLADITLAVEAVDSSIQTIASILDFNRHTDEEDSLEAWPYINQFIKRQRKVNSTL
jgi:hypothetical protein